MSKAARREILRRIEEAVTQDIRLKPDVFGVIAEILCELSDRIEHLEAIKEAKHD
jgi:hypothetical protein